jgi:hypothetical protein
VTALGGAVSTARLRPRSDLCRSSCAPPVSGAVTTPARVQLVADANPVSGWTAARRV